MRFMGFADAHTSPGGGPDGGIDVRSTRAVAQVKATVGAVGRPVVQQVCGVASLENVLGMVFAIGGFTDEAVDWAHDAGVALFVFDLAGGVEAMNGAARRVLGNASGIESFVRQFEEDVARLRNGEVLRAKTHWPADPAQWSILRSSDRFVLNAAGNPAAWARQAELLERRKTLLSERGNDLVNVILGRSASRFAKLDSEIERIGAELEALAADLAEDELWVEDMEAETASQLVDGLTFILEAAGYTLGDFVIEKQD